MFIYPALRTKQLLGIILIAVADGLFKVVQTPERIESIVGENVIFSCTFSSSEDTSDVDIYWWKLGEKELIQPDIRKRIDTREGIISLLLLNVNTDDSGAYHCRVTFKGINVAKGSGSQLIVSASPTPLRIVSHASGRNGSGTSTLVCEMAPFYLAGLTIAWYKNNKSFETGISTTHQLDAAGMFEASSSLEEPRPSQDRCVYVCLVTHISLKIPAMAIHIVPDSNSGRYSTWTSVCSQIFGHLWFALTILVLVTIIGIWLRFSSYKGQNPMETSSSARKPQKFANGLYNINGTTIRPPPPSTPFPQTNGVENDCNHKFL